MTQEFLDEIQRRNLYFQIAKDLELHLEERTEEEGPPSIKDIAKHYMGKVGHEHATMTPLVNEFTEWYYGAGELRAWCQEVPELFPSERFSGMHWVPTPRNFGKSQ